LTYLDLDLLSLIDILLKVWQNNVKEAELAKSTDPHEYEILAGGRTTTISERLFILGNEVQKRRQTKQAQLNYCIWTGGSKERSKT